MASIDTNLVSALGAGSGVDIKALAQGLVDAEKNPRQTIIQGKIDRSEAKISGYSAMMATLGALKDKFSTLSLKSGFSSLNTAVSNPSVLSVTPSASAAVGRYSLTVNALAQPQVSELAWDHDSNGATAAQTGFNSATESLSGSAFSLTLTKGVAPATTSTVISVAANQASPEGLVEAINEAEAGVTARLVDTGAASNRYKVVLTGASGGANAFSLASSVGTLATASANLQSAQDAVVVMDGVTYTRSVNSISDLIPGATVSLASSQIGSPVSVDLTRDTSEVKQKLKDIVSAYNDVVNDLGILSGPKSEDEEDVFSGSLQSDSTVRLIKNQVRAMIFGDSKTPSGSITSLFDLGVTVDREGVASLDEAKFDAVFAESPDDVMEAVAGSVRDGDVLNRGIAGDAVNALASLMSPTGVIVTQSNNAAQTVSRYEEDLEKLDDRMESLLQRYQQQFAAMESIVGQITSMRESLKGTFESLSAAYSQK